MMSKPKYIVILKGLFCSVVAGVLRTFTRFCPVNVLARVDFFWFDNYGLWPWQAKPRPKTLLCICCQATICLETAPKKVVEIIKYNNVYLALSQPHL